MSSYKTYRPAPRTIHTAELSLPPSVVFATTAAGLLLVWMLLANLNLVPTPLDLLLHLTGQLLGPSARKTLATTVAPPRARPPHVDDPNGSIGGLWNVGNTCYQNSVLQALSSLHHLPEFLGAHDGEETAAALLELVRDLNELRAHRSSIPVPALTRSSGSRGWSFGEQQDAQEFLQGLMGALEKETTRAVKASREVGLEAALDRPTPPQIPDALRSPFEGLLAQRVGCLKCGYVESISLQPFTTLSLPLPDSWRTDIDSCISAYTALEYIPEVECDKCTLLHLQAHLTRMQTSIPATSDLHATITTRLTAVTTALGTNIFPPKNITLPKQKTTADKTKQVMISRAPPVLVLHTNRSRFDPLSGNIGKNACAVNFPLHLRLPVTADLQTDCLDVDISAHPERRGYVLRSVVAHYGGHHNGHYVAYRQWGGEWWRISDEDVVRVPEDVVRAAGNAFMLFYERVDGEGEEEEVAETVTEDVGQEEEMEQTQLATPPPEEEMPEKVVEVETPQRQLMTPEPSAPPSPLLVPLPEDVHIQSPPSLPSPPPRPETPEPSKSHPATTPPTSPNNKSNPRRRKGKRKTSTLVTVN